MVDWWKQQDPSLDCTPEQVAFPSQFVSVAFLAFLKRGLSPKHIPKAPKGVHVVDLWKQEDPSLDCNSQPPESHQEFGDHKDDFGAYLTLIMSKDVQGGPI